MNAPFKSGAGSTKATFGKSRGGSRKAIAVVTTGRFSIDSDARREAVRIELSLPMPPSVNGLYANAESGGRFKTEEYEAWLSEAGWRIQAQRPGRIVGPYEIEIRIARPHTKRRMDLENRMKAVSDLLVKQRVIADDSLAQRITMEWGPQGSECAVVLTRSIAKDQVNG